jgi:hypothetical protein
VGNNTPKKGCRCPGILAIKDFLQLLSKGVFLVKIENFYQKNTPKLGRREKKFHFFSLLPHHPKQLRFFLKKTTYPMPPF